MSDLEKRLHNSYLWHNKPVEYGEWCYKQGRAEERKKIMEIIDNADDMANAMYLLGQYIISEQLKENKE